MPLLTIAIPTYSRRAHLDRLLASLLPQLEGEDRVELLISDNASQDETTALLEEYSRRGLRFRSIRNAVNLGPDLNFAQCFAEATGKYLWVFGDDDVFYQGAVAIVLELLARDEFDLVHVGSKEFAFGAPLPRANPDPRIEIIADARAFTRPVHIYLTFISGLIIHRERALEIPHRPYEELAETNLLQLGWTYTLLRAFRRGARIHDPLVAAGVESRGGYKVYHVYGTNLQRINRQWLERPELVRIVANGALQEFFPRVVLARRLGMLPAAEQEPAALLAEAFSGNFLYYLYIYPLLKLPPILGRVWLRVDFLLNRLDALCGYPLRG